jgi:hypothetical protein
MRRSGEDLSTPRDISFSVAFPNQTAADEFASYFRQFGDEVFVNRSGADKMPWDVTIVNYMLPSHHHISKFQTLLGSIAAALGGQSNGWDCFHHSPWTNSQPA